MSETEKRISQAIATLENFGMKLDRSKPFTFTLKDQQILLEIVLNPPDWIGMEFSLLNNGRKDLEFSINTDLYNTDSYREFRKEVGDEILHFLMALKNGEILIGKHKGKISMLIPSLNNRWILLSKGLIFNSISRVVDKSAVLKDGQFTSLKIGEGHRKSTTIPSEVSH